ncbi:MAG: response regulator [Methanosarcinales archaeon]|nr:response regulator [Methanosarcinales archaeon]
MRKNRILIVEDAPYMREMIIEMLNHAQDRYEVVGFAINGKEAIEKYRELKPDLVTMDLVMEEMDGIQAIRKIKQEDPNALILVITAMDTPENRTMAMDAGADGYLWKPFTINNLLDVLEEMFGKD